MIQAESPLTWESLRSPPGHFCHLPCPSAGPQSARVLASLLLSPAEPPGDLFVVFQIISSDMKQDGGLAVAGAASLEMPPPA